MSVTCGTVNPEAVARSLLAVADCQTAALGDGGWHALSGSALFATLLTGLLTLAVAREGYRLLAGGDGLVPADAVRVVLRFGMVIALSTSWTAYDRLIHRVAMDGPAELAATIFPSAGIDSGALGSRLQNAYDAIATPPAPSDQPATPPAQVAQTRPAAPAGGGDDGASRATAASVLLVTGAGLWIAARLALALLLAIGPIAIAAALFEVSAGLFVGWVRAVLGAALATLVLPLGLALELQMLAGPVTTAVRDGSAHIAGLDAIVWIFALVNAALLVAVQRVAGGVQLPRLHLRAGACPSGSPRPADPAPAGFPADRPARHLPPPASALPSRATTIAQALEARGRSVGNVTVRGIAASAPTVQPIGVPRAAGIAEAHRNAAAGRRSLSGKRLDIRS